MGDCALITPVYLEIALLSGARSGTRAIGQVISAIDIADISIRTLCEEGDAVLHGVRQHSKISIHALREEGDGVELDSITGRIAFLSTPSARRATGDHFDQLIAGDISIHALREEGDAVTRSIRDDHQKFLSTPSARRATICAARRLTPEEKFLSTPSARRATICAARRLTPEEKFLSTPSARRATEPVGFIDPDNKISIHTLREEGDRSAVW